VTQGLGDRLAPVERIERIERTENEESCEKLTKKPKRYFKLVECVKW
jgi:hypothetical protein